MKNEIAVIGLRGFPNVQGGVEKHCEALYRRMDGFRFNVYRRKPYLVSGGEESYDNITFTDLPSSTISGVEAMGHTFMAALHLIVRRPRLVHVHNIGPGLVLPLLKLFGLRTVMTYHSANYEHKKWSRLGRLLLRSGEWLSLRFADRVIFVNSAQREKVGGAVIEKTRYIPNGVVHHTPSEDTDFITSLGLTPGKYILGVGRLTPEKGFEYLVEAVNRLEGSHTLVIAGGSDNNDDYYQKLRKLDSRHRVIFTGNLQGEQLRQLYSHAGLFVLSSVNEGFPLVLLEAMDYGLPILATDIPGARMAKLDEADYFPAADTDGLVKALERRLAENGPARKKYDLSAYDWDRIGQLTSEVYNEILGPSSDK
ncbi:MAG: glycosyltransferase family 4 protein [Bacteroides sp.]|nr:glycosyltransferase family 4 protein [Bacteroides sp.]